MSEGAEPILNNQKLLEKISKIEQLSDDLFSLKNEYANINDIISKNKEFINYLYEHQNIKDLKFYMLYPNMNIINENKNGVFHELQRKDSIQYIQNMISNSMKNKGNIDSKINEVKKKLIDTIEDPVEMNILDKDIYEMIFPLACKKFPSYFKLNEDDIELDD